MYIGSALLGLAWGLVVAPASPVESPEGEPAQESAASRDVDAPESEAIPARSVPAPRVRPGAMNFTPEAVWVGRYRLVQQADGRWTHFSAREGVIAHVAADGTVRFEYPGGLGNDPEVARLQLEANAQRGMDDSSVYDPRARAAYAPDPAEGAAAGAALGVALAGITAAARGAKSAGKPLTVARQEADFLAETADFRSDLARAYYAETYALAVERLGARYQSAWRTKGPAQRGVGAGHWAVYELWAGFEDGLPMPAPGVPLEARGAIERLRAEFGRTGREKIEGLVRVTAPDGSGRAYSAAQLASLNRGARRRFEPYGARVEHPPKPPKTKRKRRRKR